MKLNDLTLKRLIEQKEEDLVINILISSDTNFDKQSCQKSLSWLLKFKKELRDIENIINEEKKEHLKEIINKGIELIKQDYNYFNY